MALKWDMSAANWEAARNRQLVAEGIRENFQNVGHALGEGASALHKALGPKQKGYRRYTDRLKAENLKIEQANANLPEGEKKKDLLRIGTYDEWKANPEEQESFKAYRQEKNAPIAKAWKNFKKGAVGAGGLGALSMVNPALAATVGLFGAGSKGLSLLDKAVEKKQRAKYGGLTRKEYRQMEKSYSQTAPEKVEMQDSPIASPTPYTRMNIKPKPIMTYPVINQTPQPDPNVADPLGQGYFLNPNNPLQKSIMMQGGAQRGIGMDPNNYNYIGNQTNYKGFQI